MFNSTVNWKTRDDLAMKDVEWAFGLMSDAARLRQVFRDGMDRFLFALMCFHPDAMITRLSNLAHAQNYTGFSQLYDRVLAEGPGKDRLIRPLSLDEWGEAFYRTARDIVYPPRFWST